MLIYLDNKYSFTCALPKVPLLTLPLPSPSHFPHTSSPPSHTSLTLPPLPLTLLTLPLPLILPLTLLPLPLPSLSYFPSHFYLSPSHFLPYFPSHFSLSPSHFLPPPYTSSSPLLPSPPLPSPPLPSPPLSRWICTSGRGILQSDRQLGGSRLSHSIWVRLLVPATEERHDQQRVGGAQHVPPWLQP